MNALLQMSPWRRAFWSIPVTLFILLFWPVPVAHPEVHPLLVIVRAQSPGLYSIWIWGGRLAPGICFFFAWQIIGSIINIWFHGLMVRRGRGKLPAWPLSVDDKGPALVIGEKHHPIDMTEVPNPTWCVMPEKGLYTGLAIFGAIGTGKTSSCMYPFVRQLFNWQHAAEEKRVAGLILEVKGDFCYAVQEMMEERDRIGDYMEITTIPGKGFRWNPLNAPWLDTYSLAYTLASIVNQLFGGGKDPFWQMAYTNCVRWIIQAYRVFPSPWFTLHDIYNCMVDKEALLKLVNEATEHVYGKYRYVLQVSRPDFQKHRAALLELELWPAGVDPDNPPDEEDIETEMFTIRPPEENITDPEIPAWSDLYDRLGVMLGDRPFKELKRVLARLDVGYCCHEVRSPLQAELDLDVKITQWYTKNWLGLDEKLRSSIVEGLSVFLGVFVVPDTARVFCPPRPDSQTEKEREDMMPALADCIEKGKVIALNMPAGENPALSRAVGVMLKGSWLGALLLRPKAMKEDENRLAEARERGEEATPRYFRPAMFVCDEYQMFATCGGKEAAGDEKAFALTRQSKCIPIVATQSIVSLKSAIGEGETWQALLQTLRSRIFLSLADNFSLEMASKLLGQVTRIRGSYSISENTSQASASVFTGGLGGAKASAGVTKNFQEKREPLFHPRDLNLLGTSQGVAQIFDGRMMVDAHRVYLKPYYLPRDKPYFRQRDEGLI